jgi:chaperonin cofactor prefoldin
MTELISTEEIKEAMAALRELNEIRRDISKKLGSISVKYQLREKVLQNLYNYYEMVADDYYCLIDRVIKVPEAIELMQEGLIEQREKLTTEMDRLREVLEKSLAPQEMRPVLKKIDNHILYQMRRHLASTD